MANHDIIVMGASYGGVKALSRIASLLPRGLPAAVFAVQHLSPARSSVLDQILTKAGKLAAITPADGQKIAAGTIHIAPPGCHLVVKKDHVRLTSGPRENRMRPSIDVLFRSAAAYYSTRVIAVLLTGLLDDGVSGLSAVKRCGGIAIVQDPAEAEASEMPQTAIEKVGVDYVLPLKAIAEKISELSGQPAGTPTAIPEDIMEEVKISEHNVPDLDKMKKLGAQTPFTCPECGGALWHLKEKEESFPRYICHTGHSFSEHSLLDGQADVIEYSLWSAIRHLQERAKLLTNMAEEERKKQRSKTAEGFEKKAEDLKYHAGVIRNFVVSGQLMSRMSN